VTLPLWHIDAVVEWGTSIPLLTVMQHKIDHGRGHNVTALISPHIHRRPCSSSSPADSAPVALLRSQAEAKMALL